jgi:hypothetical protein
MIDRSSISRPTSFYDLFLYAPVCDQRNGMQLTVISALARMNKDPWEEAARMTAMPKAAAEKELVSILRRASDITWMQPEAEAIAVRLTQLLPRDGGNGRAAPTDAVRVVRVYVRRSLLWLVWLGFAMPVSLMPPRDRSKVADPSVAAPSSSAISASESHISNKN